jgi:hypothetical protein
VPERRHAGLGFDQHPERHRLVNGIRAGKLRDERQIERHARDAGDPEQPPRIRRQRLDAGDRRVSDGVGNRDRAPGNELEPGPRGALGDAVSGDQRRAQLLDEERDALRPVVDRGGKRIAWRHTQRACRQRRGRRRVQGLERELTQPARPPELDAHASHRMPSRGLVAAVCAEQQHRLVRHTGGQRRQQLERRRVGPVQVVEVHDDGAPPGNRAERGSHGFKHAGAVTIARRAPKLGQ